MLTKLNPEFVTVFLTVSLFSFRVFKNLFQRKCFLLSNDFIFSPFKGNISRQEAVSMIPPLLLNVNPDHKVT